MSRIVLTGATGLLGARTAVRLAAAGHEVHAVVRRHPAAPVPGVLYHAVDLAGSWSTEELPARADAVLHFAQSAHMREFPEHALDIYAVNLAATARLLDYARGAGAVHFMLASTGGLYGTHAGPVAETAVLVPPRGHLGFYFDTKRSAELLANAYSHLMSVCVLRPFFIYGAGQRPAMLVPRLIDSVRAGRAVRVRGERGTRLNPVHVDDAVTLIEGCLAAEGSRVLNVAGPEVVTIRDMTERIATLAGVAAMFESEAGEAESYVADITAMRAIVRRPLIDFSTGVASMLAGAAQ